MWVIPPMLEGDDRIGREEAAVRLMPCFECNHVIWRPLQASSLIVILASVLTAQDTPYRYSRGGLPVRRMGIAKNSEIGFVKSEASGIRQVITALEGNQTSWMTQAGKDPQQSIIPFFLPGDSGIRVKVDPAVGFTAVAGLKLRDPVVLMIHADGLVESDREGVRASVWSGEVRPSDCFAALKQQEGAFILNEPFASDGSLDPFRKKA
jgi:hypothetical protein